VACRPQSNPSSISSDGVPPELLVLDLSHLPGAPVYPVRISGLISLRREAASGDRFDDLAVHSSTFECVTRFCVNNILALNGGDEIVVEHLLLPGTLPCLPLRWSRS